MQKGEKEENKYLENTINEFERIIEETEEKKIAIQRMYADKPEVLYNLLEQTNKKLKLLKTSLKKPYFARINFNDYLEKTEYECYIGKIGVTDDDNKIITVDWRAPISSLYYDSNIGETSYKAPAGVINGNLTVKRQYTIEEGNLISYQDVDTVSNDEILKPYLGATTDNRLKNIVSTIQKEQNQIIREKFQKNLIVQGVAGSGKTTVALHRIAYLVYNNIDIVKPNQYLIIGPNNFFVNYISSVLPDLDVEDVTQSTLFEMIKNLLDEEIELIPEEINLNKSLEKNGDLSLQTTKNSLKMKTAIDKYFENYIDLSLPKENLEINGYLVIPKEIILDVFKQVRYSAERDKIEIYDSLNKKIERTILLLGKYIDENKEKILYEMRQKYFDQSKATTTSSEITKLQKNKKLFEKDIENKCQQKLKKHFLKMQPKTIHIYMEFLKDLYKYIDNIDSQAMKSIKENLINLKNKKIEFEDLASMLYFYTKINGKEDKKYKQVIVDEAQDLGAFNYYALKNYIPNASYSIFGDLAQSIYQYRSIQNWEEATKDIFINECTLMNLNKSYRTTTNIMKAANNITRYLNLNEAEPVIREGNDVEYIETKNDKTDCIINKLIKYKEKGYESIAIICKDTEKTKKIHNELNENKIKTQCIFDSNTKYNGGICVISNHLAKGLEFDSVIVEDASDSIYDANKSSDMKLLYVAMTRPLHELTILYNEKITLALKHETTKRKIKQ